MPGADDLGERVALAVSELVGNAVLHGAGDHLGLALGYDGCLVRVEVTDASSQRAELKAPSDTDEGGRGLLLVEALSYSWGTSGDGRCTWCTLPVARVCYRSSPPATPPPASPPSSAASEPASATTAGLSWPPSGPPTPLLPHPCPLPRPQENAAGARHRASA
ncbi:ATP-binding protein [Streptomyces sp. GSL17-111]|uniref:ATP-binding protein n=1 Tax=Streptomyces sp. GSL17-111 TaxID=3121596 RepID=UPI004040A8D1